MAVTAYQILVARTAAALVALVTTAIAGGKKPTGPLTSGLLPNGEFALFQAVATDSASSVTAYAIAQGANEGELNAAVAVLIAASKLPSGIPVQGSSPNGSARLYQVCIAGSLAGGSSGTVTKSDVGLGNADNTSDASKPVSTAQQTALDAKLAAAGAVTSVAGRAGAVVLAKADVGLSSVDNTTDAGKPVSTATQTALDAKADGSGVSASIVIPTVGTITIVNGVVTAFA